LLAYVRELLSVGKPRISDVLEALDRSSELVIASWELLTSLLGIYFAARELKVKQLLEEMRIY